MLRTAAAALLVMLTGTFAAAKTAQFHARVPFPFAVYESWLPAGDYVIRYENNFLRFQAGKTIINVPVWESPTVVQPASKLRFEKTSEGYKLCRVPGIMTNFCRTDSKRSWVVW